MLPVAAAALVLTATAAEPAAFLKGLASDEGWREVAKKRHPSVGPIQVRHKRIAGLDCLEGIAHTTATIEGMLAAATDFEGIPSWSSADLLDSEDLTGGNPVDFFQVLDSPFPVKDRYWFLRGTTIRGPDGTTEFRWQHLDAAQNHPEAHARVKAAYPSAIPTGANVGAWVFSPAGDQNRVHYRLCSDPGGKLPEWVGHFAAKVALPTNVADIIERAQGKR